MRKIVVEIDIKILDDKGQVETQIGKEFEMHENMLPKFTSLLSRVVLPQVGAKDTTRKAAKKYEMTLRKVSKN